MKFGNGISRTLIGIDIGARYIKAAQLIGTGADKHIAAAGCFARPEPSSPLDQHEVHRLRKMLAQSNFKGNSKVCHL